MTHFAMKMKAYYLQAVQRSIGHGCTCGAAQTSKYLAGLDPQQFHLLRTRQINASYGHGVRIVVVGIIVNAVGGFVRTGGGGESSRRVSV